MKAQNNSRKKSYSNPQTQTSEKTFRSIARVPIKRYLVISFCAFFLQGCSAEKEPKVIGYQMHDNLDTCFKPDNATFYMTDVGVPCRAGDHLAFPCYRSDGSVFGVQRGETNYIQTCLKNGGTIEPPKSEH